MRTLLVLITLLTATSCTKTIRDVHTNQQPPLAITRLALSASMPG